MFKMISGRKFRLIMSMNIIIKKIRYEDDYPHAGRGPKSQDQENTIQVQA